MEDSIKKENFLLISGGAEKAIAAVNIIRELDNELKEIRSNKSFIEHFDAVAGISSGSLIAACLAIPDKEKQIPKYSIDECEEFFLKGVRSLEVGIFDKFLMWIGYKKHAFSIEVLTEAIGEKLGETRLNETLVDIFITAMDVTTSKTKIWTTHEAKSHPEDHDKNPMLKDITAASSAFPGAFDQKIINGKGYVDGGLILESPLIQFLNYKEVFLSERNNRKFVKDQEKDNSSIQEKLDNVFLLSIGSTSGVFSKTFEEIENSNFDAIASYLIDVMSDSPKEEIDSFVKYFFPHYYKLDFLVPSSIQHFSYKDYPEDFKKFDACTKEYIKENKQLLKAIVDYYINPEGAWKLNSSTCSGCEKILEDYTEYSFSCDPEKVLPIENPFHHDF